MRSLLKKIFKPLAPIFYNTPWIYHTYHKAMAYIAAIRFGFPGKQIPIIGVTGTNGKTTTAYLLAQILKESGFSTGLVTTVLQWIGGEEMRNEKKLTTQSPEDLQKLLSEMLDAGDEIAVVEVSSHALKQDRLFGSEITGAILTNLTRDHMDFHKTFKDYKESKEKLFKNLSSAHYESMASVNGEAPEAKKFLSHKADRKITFNQQIEPYNSVTAENVENTESGISFTLNLPSKSVDIDLPMIGRFNVENAQAAASMAHLLNIKPETIQKALNNADPMPGRMEIIQNDPYKVIIDYAHTPDGYRKALSSLKDRTENRLIVVFGAAGDRDKGKRPEIGEIAFEYGDILVLTEEDPASEDPKEIADDILKNIDIDSLENKKLIKNFNRIEALRKAIDTATVGDTVVALGIGAQTTMEYADKRLPYNEKETIKELLANAR